MVSGEMDGSTGGTLVQPISVRVRGGKCAQATLVTQKSAGARKGGKRKQRKEKKGKGGREGKRKHVEQPVPYLQSINNSI